MIRRSSANSRSGEQRARAAACSRATAQRLGLGFEAQLDSDAREAQHAQRIFGERARGDHSQPVGRQIGDAAVWIDRRAAGERLGDRVDREVAQREVGLERAAAQRLDVDLPRGITCADAPGAELLRQREAGGAPCGTSDRAGRLARIAVDDEIEIARLTSQQPVADRSADQPGRTVRERGASGLQRVSHRAPAPRIAARRRRARARASRARAPCRRDGRRA